MTHPPTTAAEADVIEAVRKHVRAAPGELAKAARKSVQDAVDEVYGEDEESVIASLCVRLEQAERKLARIPMTKDGSTILPGDELYWALWSGTERIRIVNVGAGEVEWRGYREDGTLDEICPYGGNADQIYAARSAADSRSAELAAMGFNEHHSDDADDAAMNALRELRRLHESGESVLSEKAYEIAVSATDSAAALSASTRTEEQSK